jgi:hypothetical protein
MIRTLLKMVLIVVLIAAAVAFFVGYRFGADGDVVAPVATTPAVPDINTEKARQTGAEIGETVATGAAQAQRALNDGGLTAKIKSKMALDDTVKALNLDVDTTAGVVTVKGFVRTEAERERALRLARETEGVTRVVDGLRVR